MPSLGMTKVLKIGFDEALARLSEALKAQGFGVLTEIDVQQTLKQKLKVDFRRYKILGACNPPFAHQALQTTLEAGLMMPCNVVVYENDDHHAVVLAIDPTQTVAASGEPRLGELAERVKEKLNQVLESLES